MESAGNRRQRDGIDVPIPHTSANTETTNQKQQQQQQALLARQGTIVDDAHAMFDLAGGSVEEPLLATLVPALSHHSSSSSTLQTLLEGNNILLPRIELRADPTTSMQFELGRSPDLRVPFRIDYARLSSKHCKFTYDASSKTLLVTDLSTNGVWVSGERLKRNEPRVVKDRDTVSLLKPMEDALHLPFVVEFSSLLRGFSTVSGASENGEAINNNQQQQQIILPSHTFDSSNLEAFQQEITCSVCLGVYIKPTCVLPCLHTFCQPCIRKYIAEQLRHGTSSSNVACPDCRATMGSIQLNHKVQALINEVTSRMKKNNPNAAASDDIERSDEEIKAMEKEADDAEEKARAAGIKSFELTASKTKKKTQDNNFGYRADGNSDDDFEEEEEDDEDSDDDDGGGARRARRGAGGAVAAAHVAHHGGGWGQGWGQGIGWGNQNHFLPGNFLFQQNNHQQGVTVCQSCRQPDARDGFQCPANGQHLLCKYCRTSYPDRPTCGIPQRCKFCATCFCDQYCGPCKNPAGVGILKNLEDQPLDALPLGNLFKSNHVEIQHFQNYLKDNNIDVKDVWKECLEKFESGAWSLDLTVPNNNNNNNKNVNNNNIIQNGVVAGAGAAAAVEHDTPVCKPCAQRIFASLLVRYRIAIARDKWPPAVGSRPDCWYGLECRTQHGNPAHAQNYNHVCIPRKAPSNSITIVASSASRSLGASSSGKTRGKSLQTINNSPKLISSTGTTGSGNNNNNTAILTLPKYGNLAISTGTSVMSVIRQDADHFPRGFAQPHSNPIDVGGFQTTSRGGARLIALPQLEKNSTSNHHNDRKHQNNNNNNSFTINNNNTTSCVLNNAQVIISNENGTCEEKTPDVSCIHHHQQDSHLGEVKIRDIWKFGLRTKAPLLTEINPSSIGRVETATTTSNNNNNTDDKKNIIRYVRIQPEYLLRGMVQPPQAEVVTVDPAVLNDDATRLMNPHQRRDLMNAQLKAREGLVALREVQAAKTKLSRTCQKLYPHGCLGCSDGPYAEDPDETAYRHLSDNHAAEASKVARKGKKDAGSFSRPHNTADVILNRDVNATNFFTDNLDQTKTLKQDLVKNYVGLDPTRTGGLRTNVACRPKDQLKSFAVGME